VVLAEVGRVVVVLHPWQELEPQGKETQVALVLERQHHPLRMVAEVAEELVL
jgi:hypothetical protein